MGGGGGQTQTTTSAPWEALNPYLLGQEATEGRWQINPRNEELGTHETRTWIPGQEAQAGLLPMLGDFLDSSQAREYYPGETVAGFTPGQREGLDATMDWARTGAGNQLGVAQSGQRQIMDLGTSNPYLSAAMGTLPGAGATVNRMMRGGTNNPYLDAMVSAAQRSGMRGFEDSANAAFDAFDRTVGNRIEDLGYAQDDALRNFSEVALPGMRQGSLARGSFGGSRSNMMQDLALSRIGESFGDAYRTLGRDVAQGGTDIMRDVIRNQGRLSTDMMDTAGRMYGGAHEAGEARALQAATLGFGTGGSAIDQQIGALGAGVGMTDLINRAGLLPGQVLQQAGTAEQIQNQRQIDADMQRYYYNPEVAHLQQVTSLFNPFLGAGGTQTTMNSGGPNPIMSAAGSGLMGYGMAAGGSMGPWMAANPWLMAAGMAAPALF